MKYIDREMSTVLILLLLILVILTAWVIAHCYGVIDGGVIGAYFEEWIGGRGGRGSGGRSSSRSSSRSANSRSSAASRSATTAAMIASTSSSGRKPSLGQGGNLTSDAERSYRFPVSGPRKETVVYNYGTTIRDKSSKPILDAKNLRYIADVSNKRFDLTLSVYDDRYMYSLPQIYDSTGDDGSGLVHRNFKYILLKLPDGKFGSSSDEYMIRHLERTSSTNYALSHFIELANIADTSGTLGRYLEDIWKVHEYRFTNDNTMITSINFSADDNERKIITVRTDGSGGQGLNIMRQSMIYGTHYDIIILPFREDRSWFSSKNTAAYLEKIKLYDSFMSDRFRPLMAQLAKESKESTNEIIQRAGELLKTKDMQYHYPEIISIFEKHTNGL